MVTSKEVTGKVRPVGTWDQSQEKSSLVGAARIWINKDTLILLTGGVESTKRCWIERTAPAAALDDDAEASSTRPVRRQAVLSCLLDKKVPPNVFLTTDAYREAAGLKLGDQLSIKLCDESSVPAAKSIVLEPLDAVAAKETPNWEHAVWFPLKRAVHVFPGMTFDCTIATYKKRFRVQSVNAETDNIAACSDDPPTISFRQPVTDTHVAPTKLVVPDIPGLAAESKKLNDFLRGFNAPFLHPRHRRSCGIAIHGGHGTGKSNLLDVVAATKWGTVFRVQVLDKSSTVEEIFKQAKAQRPSIILIDDLHALIGKDRANSSTIIFKLGQQLDELAEEARTQGALPKVAVIASCSDYLTDMPAELQRSTRFQLNIALPIPNLAGREQVLHTLSESIAPEERSELVAYLAKHTHAFNPADLDRLMSTAIHLLETRIDPDQQGHALSSTPYVTRADLDAALRCTRPTAMHDINLKPPTVQWSDIGGQDGLKKALKRMIALSTTTDPRVRALIINPPKGLLLYGPPGCSKTMSAQALATESNFNFFAVKGAELLNMYVGESERAVRELFQRAREAAPSIIFFDEIDSIGGQRAGSSGGGGGGGGAARSQGSVNMLTTLLTEMDGFESLPGVLILAATNRPEAIDPALLRPGRFDSLVYVGMPTEAGREAILRTYMGKVRSEPGMDFTELARRADGFSGAEMKQICNMASERAVDECLDGIRTGDDSMITFRDIAGAMETMPKGVTAAMLAGYEKWATRFSRQ
ncbi:hypothetical protein VD0004_g6190 [Verticillium dahliae]|uniref:Uncharacterized protein n=1 Tax=Verticillium dahliae TaxID=27337 RepID=A0A366PQJ3_VERDA|nr:hypothetical protein VD0004_g6190 [Verticillium dahliae]PNH75475.1 hypothetical protein VD0001_g2069 [Verticillium dahliae]RBQ94267.1 hypothetical protein VDGD_01940 [Verticillium dahliae]RXG50286.1 hypothetical protein VDGE_01940 [Verticillium dahliae]